MVDFCYNYHITLGHSTAYYPQRNGLANSSNKILVNITKKLLEENKKSWHGKLVHALWADRLTTKKSINMYPYQLVYGMDVVFPTSLGVPVMKLLQEVQSQENDKKKRLNQTIHLHHSREEVYKRTQVVQENITKIFDRRTKANYFHIGDIVLNWDSRSEDKGKHGKFENLWKGPYIIHSIRGNNAFFLQELDGAEVFKGPFNGRMLKHYFCQSSYFEASIHCT